MFIPADRKQYAWRLEISLERSCGKLYGGILRLGNINRDLIEDLQKVKTMAVHSAEIDLDTSGEIEIIDITVKVRTVVKESGIVKGLVNIFVPGATGAVATIEYEPRLVEDTKNLLNKLVPKGIGYQHDYQDDNAHSHLRATLLSPAVTIPVNNNEPILGTWQQIVFLELDTRGRERKVLITVLGDKK